MSKRITSLLLCLLIVFLLGVCAFAEEEKTYSPDEIMQYVSDISYYVSQYYKFNVTQEELKDEVIKYMLSTGKTDLDGILNAMFEILDEHSTYMNEEEYAEFYNRITASSTGIGVTLVKTENGLCISYVIPDSPADKAGLSAFDTIVSIGETNIVGMDIDAALALAPTQLGSPILLGVVKDGQTEAVNVTLIRANLYENPVAWHVLDDKTAYIKISILTTDCDMYVKSALDEIDKLGITKIVLDLRDNPGGSVNATVKICGMFMPKGVVGYIEPKDYEQTEIFYSENENPKYTLAVLINGGTASGAEFLSGGLQDTGIGKLFGEQSYGKGTAQDTIPLTFGGAFKLTTAKYYTAGKQDVAKNHINPDEVVSNAYQLINEEAFAKLDFETPITIGSKGSGVLAIEQRLAAVQAFSKTPDEYFDEETMQSLRQFKLAQGWVPTAEVDFYVLARLNDLEYSKMYVEIDKQLEAAHNYLKERNAA